MPAVTVPPICWLMFLLVILVWPISTAGFQYAADDVLRGRRRSLQDQFSAALQRWGRMLSTGLVVYASYFFWVFVPFTTMVALLAGGVSVFSLMLYLLIGAFMIYMIGRLFINFLFWEQTAAFGDDGALPALRESRELARCAPDAPRPDRPLYRGVMVASLWLVLLLVLYMGVQFPFMVVRLSGAENPEQAMALIQKLAEAQDSRCAHDRVRYRDRGVESSLAAAPRRRLSRALLRCQSARGQDERREMSSEA